MFLVNILGAIDPDIRVIIFNITFFNKLCDQKSFNWEVYFILFSPDFFIFLRVYR